MNGLSINCGVGKRLQLTYAYIYIYNIYIYIYELFVVPLSEAAASDKAPSPYSAMGICFFFLQFPFHGHVACSSRFQAPQVHIARA